MVLFKLVLSHKSPLKRGLTGGEEEMEAGSEVSLLGIPIPISEWSPRDLKSLRDTVCAMNIQ